MSERTLPRLGVREIAAMLGIPGDSVSPASQRLIEEADLTYRLLEGAERDHAVREAEEVLASDRLTAAGSHRQADWESGWAENLQSFTASGSADDLMPRYFGRANTLRLAGRYVRPVHPAFLSRFHRICVRVLAERHLAGAAGIWEFGCGTGHNLALLAGLFPGKQLVGLDWARSAVRTVEELGAKGHGNVRGHLFDLFRPDPALVPPSDAAVLTVHALEQLGTDFRPFLDYLLQARPSRCLHIEPIIELYNAQDAFDRPAIGYHRKRGYLDGYLTALRELDRAGSIRIEVVKRTGIGSAFDEGYSVILWRAI